MSTSGKQRSIPADVLTTQLLASDPASSAFVTANAGSGKTYVLAQRVIRLLLQGTDPAKILCLTFTKAAAANMANRVFTQLAAWTALDDASLDAAVAQIDGRPPSTKRRAAARRLFAQALDTPGGLKVQTIHAFCTRLLHQFPFEAQVAAHFAVLEERSEEELIGALRLRVLLEASARPDSGLGRALQTAIAQAADQSFTDALRAVIAERDALNAWLDEAGGVAAAMADLSHVLGIPPDLNETDIADALLSGSLLAAADLDEIIVQLHSGSTNDQKQGNRLEEAARLAGTARTEAYISMFVTGEGQPRKALVTKPIRDLFPRTAERLAAEQGRVLTMLEQRRAVATRERTSALLTLGAEILCRYREEKQRRGFLDYNDLIERTLLLLEHDGAAWVHYKLDLGIDHVLIDEAQDTSPRQWHIIRRLVAEFTSGEGARGACRTIFAVGDEKQSIYSFQGAAPRAFGEMRQHFQRAHQQSGLNFRPCQFKLSFRSGLNVLTAVDQVFSERLIAASITDDEAGMPAHAALPDAAPGLVEIWPLIEPAERAGMQGWDHPFDAMPETSPVVTLARRVARTIKVWIGRGEMLGDGRPVQPGDILVLVRQRGALFDAIIRALKDADVEVAGADRLVLTEHIAVMDLMVLADALLSPQDDLALATALKSPLFGLDDDRLLALAWGRTGSLRDALGIDPALADVAARLDSLALAARQQSPFSFYAELLGAGRGRAQFLARLGAEANDALDEFLALALDYGRRAPPSLQGFIGWMRAASSEIKRDMDIAREEVRVMTVHGAKGLEAPIVFIADTTTNPTGPRSPLLLRLRAEGKAPGTPDRIVWPARKELDVEIVAKARSEAMKAAEDEYRRLLYVALTRAAERLIICGARGQKEKPRGCWYDLVTDALAAEAVDEAADDGDGLVRRWRRAKAPQPARICIGESEVTEKIAVPDWLTGATAQLARLDARVTPSTSAARTKAPGTPRPLGRIKGVLIHRLLQSLPDVARERRAEIAHRYLAHAAGSLDGIDLAAIAAEVLAVLDEPRFAALFAPGSRAEVPIVGRLALGGEFMRVFGQVDRLAVSATAVQIADYKTDRPAPRELSEVPRSYLRQLALYAAVLREVYPGRAMNAAIVWTDGPFLMEVPSSALEEALTRLSATAA